MSHPYIRLLQVIGMWARRSASTLWLVGAAVYLSVMAGRAVYQNYQSQQESQVLIRQLANAELERERLKALIIYYRSASYQEQELRRALLLKRPGETVYALPETSDIHQPGEITEDSQISQVKKTVSGLPGWKQWIQYLQRGKR